MNSRSKLVPVDADLFESSNHKVDVRPIARLESTRS